MSLFPEGPPTDDFEHLIKELNSQSFPSSAYARVDDILVQALFRTKRNRQNYRALLPATAGDATDITDEEALAISNIIRKEISRDYPTAEECRLAALNIWVVYYKLLHEGDLTIIEQYVI
jgi:hypothetical protein